MTLPVTESTTASQPVLALCLISLSAAAPLLCLLGCVAAASPTRAARQRDSLVSDALLEEVCSGAASLRTVYDVHGGARWWWTCPATARWPT